MWQIDKIEDYVKSNMSEKRWRHVQGVVETAGMLAEKHGVDVTRAKLAALVHDVVKEQDLDEAKQILAERGEEVYLANSSKVWHAPLGAMVAQEVFGIEDEDVLLAVRHHPTGRAAMSDLEKVLFVADYTEPNRKYEGCVVVRALWDNLDLASAEILKQKLDKNSASPTMHPDTLAAHEYYRESR